MEESENQFPRVDPGEAVAQSIRTHGKRLRQYVDRHLPAELREYIEAQDVIQDVCLEAFRRSTDFPAHDGDQGLRWFFTLARHRMIDLIRQHRALKRGGPNARVRIGVDDSLVAMLEELGLYLRTPSRSAAAREFLLAVDDALSHLEPDYAQVIRLRHVDGLSGKEAAERMGRTEKAVEALCARGLAALRAEMRSVSLFV